jgi:hypothetical protein
LVTHALWERLAIDHFQGDVSGRAKLDVNDIESVGEAFGGRPDTAAKSAMASRQGQMSRGENALPCTQTERGGISA